MSQPTRRWTSADFALASRTLPGASLVERIQVAADNGLRAIGLGLLECRQALAAGLSPNAITGVLDAYGVGVSEVEVLRDWAAGGRADDLSPDDEVLTLARLTRARYAVAVAGDQGTEAEVAERVGALADRAARLDVRVALEFMPWTAVPDLATARRVVSRAARHNLGLLVDVWHLHRTGGTAHDLRDLAPGELFGVQVADAGAEPCPDLRWEALYRRRLPGDGVIDLASLLAALEESGNVVPASVEVMSDDLAGRGPSTTARLVAASIQSILAATAQPTVTGTRR